MRGHAPRAGARAALARRRRAASPGPRQWPAERRASRAPRAVPQVPRVVRSRVVRAERGPPARPRSAARGARRRRSAPSLLLPRAPSGLGEAGEARREERRVGFVPHGRAASILVDRPHVAARGDGGARLRAARGGLAALRAEATLP